LALGFFQPQTDGQFRYGDSNAAWRARWVRSFCGKISRAIDDPQDYCNKRGLYSPQQRKFWASPPFDQNQNGSGTWCVTCLMTRCRIKMCFERHVAAAFSASFARPGQGSMGWIELAPEEEEPRVDSSDSIATFYQVVLQCLIEYPCRALHSPTITFSHAIRVGAVQVVGPDTGSTAGARDGTSCLPALINLLYCRTGEDIRFGVRRACQQAFARTRTQRQNTSELTLYSFLLWLKQLGTSSHVTRPGRLDLNIG
jgi:hypothetical protein